MKDLDQKLIQIKDYTSENEINLSNKQQEDLYHLISDLKVVDPSFSSFSSLSLSASSSPASARPPTTTSTLTLLPINNKESAPSKTKYTKTTNIETLRNQDITSASNITTLLTKQKVNLRITLFFDVSEIDIVGSFSKRIRGRNNDPKKYCH